MLSLTVIVNITDALRDHSKCKLAAEPDEVLREMVRIFKQNLAIDSGKESNEKIIASMMNILMGTSKRPVLVMLLAHMLDVYSEFVQAKINDQQIVLAQVITIIHTCLLSLSKFPIERDIKNELKQKLYELVDLHLQISGIEQEGINMISGFAILYKKDFLNEQLDKYWPFVMDGMNSVEQKATFKAALNCVADIARCDETRVISKLSPIFQQLVAVMHQSTDR